MIYFDNAATTYPKPECVYKALDDANRNLAFNAGRGSYIEAKRTSDMIEDTRRKVAEIINVIPEKVYFESSATEAMNIIIHGLDLKDGDNVYISPFEHNAVVRPLYSLKKRINLNVIMIPFDKKTWNVDITKMKDLFSMYRPRACFLTHISNVTGYILPIGVIFDHAKQYNCINVLDCSQSFGVINPPIKDVDYLVFAGHKSLYASFGVAGFVNVNNNILKIYKSGGTGSDSLNVSMPETGSERYESGSINSVAIAGLNTSIDWLKQTDVYKHENHLTYYLLSKLSSMGKIQVFMPEHNEIFGIVSIVVDGYNPYEVGQILSEEFGICVRTGYHCAPFVHDFIGSRDIGGTIRISFGYFNKKEEIDILCEALNSL